MTKYIGPKTADENVATQADKLSLSSATPDALTPDQAGAAGTATTAARSDHQHEILAGAAGTILPDDAAAEGASTSFARADHTHAITAAAPSANLTASTTNSEGTASSFARSDHSHAITTGVAGTITGTNAEGTSTSFARADHNHAFGSKSVPTSALALGPTYETSLPASPVDGQEIYYQASGDMTTQGIVWHLRYRSGSSSSYKWELIGGAALRTTADPGRTITNQTSYTDLPTDPLSLTIPLAGEYEVGQGANLNNSNTSGAYSGISVAITNASNTIQTEATDDMGSWIATGNLGTQVFAVNVRTITTAGWKLRERAATGGNWSLTAYRRRLIARPIRVG